MYDSEFCSVRYEERYNVVFVEWKKFCCGEQYREPLRCALDIIAAHEGCCYAADTRSGFENAPEDTAWVAEYFMPQAAARGCRIIWFIIDRDNSLREELEGQASDSADIMEFRYVYALDELPCSDA